jgi:hypothetical protein
LLRQRGLSPWHALWLVACLVLAQHAGLTHRVAHGGLQGISLSVLATSGHANGDTTDAPDGARADIVKQAGHSCVLFDGATAADGACGAPVLPRLAHGKPVLPPSITWRWPHLPPSQPFDTRAPPAPLAVS